MPGVCAVVMSDSVARTPQSPRGRRTSGTTSSSPTWPSGTSRESAMTSPSLRESVLAFMTSNPTAWRIKAVAAKLGVGVQRMGFELSQLNAEGKLVSCTVKAPGRQPEEEYRIAATEQRVDPHHFVISRQTTVRLRGAG